MPRSSGRQSLALVFWFVLQVCSAKSINQKHGGSLPIFHLDVIVLQTDRMRWGGVNGSHGSNGLNV